MVTQNQIKYIKSLNQKKFRQKYNKFIVEGDKICRDVLTQVQYEIDVVYALKTWFTEQEEILSSKDILLSEVSERELQKISSLKTANKALCILSIPDANITLTAGDNCMIYLDDIKDPGNMGTIMRIANWFGIESVVASHESVDFYNPKVIQASMGSFLNTKLIRSDLEALIELHEDKAVIGATLSGSNLYQHEWNEDTIIVIGNESKGISRKNRRLLDEELTIPVFGENIDSLNAAISTAIMCSEFRKGKVK